MSATPPLTWGRIIVPWTARWSSEDDTDFVVRKMSIGAKTLPFICETLDQPGVGRPKLATMHVGRTIDVVRRKVCQICCKPLPAPAYCFNRQGQTWGKFPLISDGLPMCEACALTALAMCPNLQEQQQAGLLQVWLATGWQPAPAILGLAMEEDGGNAKINAALAKWKDPPVYGIPKLVLRNFIRIPTDAIGHAMRAAKPAETHPKVENPPL